MYSPSIKFDVRSFVLTKNLTNISLKSKFTSRKIKDLQWGFLTNVLNAYREKNKKVEII